MAEPQQAVDLALDEVEKLRTSLRRVTSKQVSSRDEKASIKAVALGWFRLHRPNICAVLGDATTGEVDALYGLILDGSDRKTLRSRYIDILLQIKRGLGRVRAQNLVALTTPSSAQEQFHGQPPLFDNLVRDTRMRDILSRRWTECTKCVTAGAQLATVVMVGGLLEALLLAKINELSDNERRKLFSATTAPKDPKSGVVRRLQDWGLADLLNVAHEVKWISRVALKVGDILRDYRNYVHPYKEYRSPDQLTLEDAQLCLSVANGIMRQLLASGKP